MKVIKSNIPEILHILPDVYSDDRGCFRETYQTERYKDAGIDLDFVQDNVVFSKKGVFRGLHFQLPPYEQAKLITVISGEVIDIAVDIRADSPTYLQQVRITLKKDEQMYIPQGFAHAYYVLSKDALISYKVSSPYAPDQQSCIGWNTLELCLCDIIKDPILSNQDKDLPLLKK